MEETKQILEHLGLKEEMQQNSPISTLQKMTRTRLRDRIGSGIIYTAELARDGAVMSSYLAGTALGTARDVYHTLRETMSRKPLPGSKT